MNDVPVPIASNSFQIREKVHNLWNFQQLGNPKKNTVKVALETISPTVGVSYGTWYQVKLGFSQFFNI